MLVTKKFSMAKELTTRGPRKRRENYEKVEKMNIMLMIDSLK